MVRLILGLVLALIGFFALPGVVRDTLSGLWLLLVGLSLIFFETDS